VLLAGIALWIVLLIVAGVLLAGGVLMLILAPLLAGRMAATASRPKLERRASGPDRMRARINAQIDERRRRRSFAVDVTRGGVVLLGAGAVALVAGGVLALTGSG
jgi:hypothetical protein